MLLVVSTWKIYCCCCHVCITWNIPQTKSSFRPAESQMCFSFHPIPLDGVKGVQNTQESWHSPVKMTKMLICSKMLTYNNAKHNKANMTIFCSKISSQKVFVSESDYLSTYCKGGRTTFRERSSSSEPEWLLQQQVSAHFSPLFG